MKYFINGKEVSREEYNHSYEDGTHQVFNGLKVKEWNLKDGQWHGLQRGWYSNGQLEYQTIYVNGKPRPDLDYILEPDMKLARVAIFGRDILEDA